MADCGPLRAGRQAADYAQGKTPSSRTARQEADGLRGEQHG